MLRAFIMNVKLSSNQIKITTMKVLLANSNIACFHLSMLDENILTNLIRNMFLSFNAEKQGQLANLEHYQATINNIR